MFRNLRAALFVLVIIAVATLAVRAETCTPSFPLEKGKALGWQGADAAYSIPLRDGRDVWIFGDTLFGQERIVAGHDPQQVHNTLGISTCDANGHFHLQYVVKRDKAGRADSYFSPADRKHWYWALDGFQANGSLWVTLLCIRHAAAPMPWAMDFETCGSDLAEIKHLDRDPQNWDVKIHPLVDDGVKAYPSATTVLDGKYVYLFALWEAGSRPLLATRIPLGGLNDPKAHLEYLAMDGSWKPGFDPAKAEPVMKNGVTELSIRYHPERKQWVAIMFDPAAFSEKIVMRTAPNITGPWTEGEVIHRVAEMLPGPARDKDTFCYAAKEHPEFEATGALLFTYVCNTMNVPSLVTNQKIYFPQVVRMPMPAGSR